MLSSSADFDQAFMESIQAHSIAAFCVRDLWFDYCHGGMPQGALHKSHGHEQLSGHTLLEQEPGMILSGVIPCFALKYCFSTPNTTRVIRFL